MAIMVKNTRQAAAIKSAQMSKKMLGKKVLELGTEYVLLFPKKDGDVVVANITGRSCNYDALNTGFIRIPDNLLDQNPETGKIKDLSIFEEFSPLSRLLYEAQEAMDRQARIDQQTEISKKTGTAIDQTALSQALEEIKIAYHGKKATKDTKEIMRSMQELFSPFVQFSFFTEAVLIPLTKDMDPMYDKAIAVEVKFSDKRIRQINEILDVSKYNDPEDPNGFLEIKFAYKGDTAQKAGANDYIGVELQHRKIDLHKDAEGNYTNPDTTGISGILHSVSSDPEEIFSRSGTVSYATPISDGEAMIRKYLASNRLLSTYIKLDSDSVKYNAKRLMSIPELFSRDSIQYKTLQDIVSQNESEGVAEADSALPDGAAQLKEAKTTRELGKAIDENSALADAINGDEISDI